MSGSPHVLAYVRQAIGLTQAELGTLIGSAAPTIQAIELGKLPLSEDLAFRINEVTGVKAEWLLDNQLGDPPPSPSELREQFASAQAGDFAGKHLTHFAPRMALVRTFRFLDQIADELGPEGCQFSGFYTQLRRMTVKLAECVHDKRLRRQAVMTAHGHLSRKDKEIVRDVQALIGELDKALRDFPRRRPSKAPRKVTTQ